MPDTVWFHQSIEKSLENVSGDFFVGTKTFLLLPDSNAIDGSNNFILAAGKIASKIAQFGQKVVVYSVHLDGFESFDKRTTHFVFKEQTPLKIKVKNLFGGFRDDESLPVIRKVGLPDKYFESDNVVCFGLLGSSSRFGISGLMSLMAGMLPTVTLAQIYMENTNGFMHRAYSEILASQIVPKNRFNILYDGRGYYCGKDIVAVESLALKTHGVPLKKHRLIKEMARVNTGDPLLLQTHLEGIPVLAERFSSTRTGAIPKVDTKRCNLCLSCLDVCPNGSIDVKDKKIIISKNCIRCGACIDECPLQALN